MTEWWMSVVQREGAPAVREGWLSAAQHEDASSMAEGCTVDGCKDATAMAEGCTELKRQSWMTEQQRRQEMAQYSAGPKEPTWCIMRAIRNGHGFFASLPRDTFEA
eukprot:1160008-Pelagomonas_calceolata.AAC.12